MVLINVARDFTSTPGGRVRSDGDFSAEEFFDGHLNPAFRRARSDEKVVIEMDGTAGYAGSFIDEAFGRLARAYPQDVRRQLIIRTTSEDLREEIQAAVIEALVSWPGLI